MTSEDNSNQLEMAIGDTYLSPKAPVLPTYKQGGDNDKLVNRYKGLMGKQREEMIVSLRDIAQHDSSSDRRAGASHILRESFGAKVFTD